MGERIKRGIYTSQKEVPPDTVAKDHSAETGMLAADSQTATIDTKKIATLIPKITIVNISSSPFTRKRTSSGHRHRHPRDDRGTSKIVWIASYLNVISA